MEIQNIYSQIEDGTPILSAQVENISRKIDSPMAEEIMNEISSYFPDNCPYDRAIVQYSESQHMDRPRMLISKDGSPSIFYLSDLEYEMPDFYSFLSDFKQRIEEELEK